MPTNERSKATPAKMVSNAVRKRGAANVRSSACWEVWMLVMVALGSISATDDRSKGVRSTGLVFVRTIKFMPLHEDETPLPTECPQVPKNHGVISSAPGTPLKLPTTPTTVNHGLSGLGLLAAMKRSPRGSRSGQISKAIRRLMTTAFASSSWKDRP